MYIIDKSTEHQQPFSRRIPFTACRGRGCQRQRRVLSGGLVSCQRQRLRGNDRAVPQTRSGRMKATLSKSRVTQESRASDTSNWIG